MEDMGQNQPPTEETPPSTPEAAKTDEPPKEEAKKTEEGKTEEPSPDAISFDKLELPEGFDKDDPLAGRFLEVMNKQYESPQERAQELINLHKDMVSKFEADAEQQFLDMQSNWQDTLIKEHGEKNLDEKLGKVAQLLDRYDSEMRQKDPGQEFGKELREAFTLTGAGNNPQTVNFLIWLAEQQSEGSPLSGAPTGGAERSRAEKMFGT